MCVPVQKLYREGTQQKFKFRFGDVSILWLPGSVASYLNVKKDGGAKNQIHLYETFRSRCILLKEQTGLLQGICEPMLTSKPWLDPSLMGEAKILVEVKQDKSFPRKLALEDQSGSMSMVKM